MLRPFNDMFHCTYCTLLKVLSSSLSFIFSIHLLKRFRFGDDDKSKLCMVNQYALFRCKKKIFFFQFHSIILEVAIYLLKKPQSLSVLRQEIGKLSVHAVRYFVKTRICISQLKYIMFLKSK